MPSDAPDDYAALKELQDKPDWRKTFKTAYPPAEGGRPHTHAHKRTHAHTHARARTHARTQHNARMSLDACAAHARTRTRAWAALAPHAQTHTREHSRATTGAGLRPRPLTDGRGCDAQHTVRYGEGLRDEWVMPFSVVPIIHIEGCRLIAPILRVVLTPYPL